MKYKFKLFLIQLLLLVSCTEKPEKMVFPEGVEVLSLGNDTGLIDLNAENKVVVFHDFAISSFFAFSRQFDWKGYQSNFPEISFLFYFSGKDKNHLESELTALEFPYPVIFDPDYRFYKENNLDSIKSKYRNLFAYRVKNDFSIGPAQIGIPELLKKQLDSMVKEE